MSPRPGTACDGMAAMYGAFPGSDFDTARPFDIAPIDDIGTGRCLGFVCSRRAYGEDDGVLGNRAARVDRVCGLPELNFVSARCWI